MTGIITSTPPLVEQPPGQSSSNPAGLPGVTYTFALLQFAQTWTAKQTFPLGNISLNAADITGTLPAATLPNPTASTLGGIQSIAAVPHNWINSISTSGVPSLSQPAFSDISGTVAATQLPNPSATTLGGIQSLAAVGSKWINTISTSGVPSATQPAFTDISGSVASAMLNADVFSTAHTWAGQQTFVALAVVNSQNANTAINVSNLSTGINAIAGYTATNSNGIGSFGVGSSGYTNVPLLANRSFVYAPSGLSGVAIEADGANPIIFAINGVEAGRFTSTGPLSLATPLPISSGGTGDTGTAWTTFAPAPSSGTATFTVNSARFKTMGKTVLISLSITVLTVGTGTGVVIITLPAIPNTDSALSGRESASNGKTVAFTINAASTSSSGTKNDASIIVVGEKYQVSGVYESQ
jgi:hypothetical protein